MRLEGAASNVVQSVVIAASVLRVESKTDNGSVSLPPCLHTEPSLCFLLILTTRNSTHDLIHTQ